MNGKHHRSSWKAGDKKRISFFLVILLVLGSALLLIFDPWKWMDHDFDPSDADSPFLRELRERAPSLNVLMITVEALRQDLLGYAGGKDIPTVAFDRLAGEGVVFSRAYTSVPLSLPSHACIFSGNFPLVHGVRDNGIYRLPKQTVTLAERFQAAGWATAAFVSSRLLHSAYGLNQGFQEYDEEFSKKENGEERAKRGAQEVNSKAIQWLKSRAKKRFFLWIHYSDPHFPYQPPPSLSSIYKDFPYGGEVANVDFALKFLMDALEELGIATQTFVILVGAEGEALGDHGENTHGFFLYEKGVRVPLLFSLPGLLPCGKKVTSLVRTVDIVPTLTEVFPLEKEPQPQGKSLLSLVFKADAEEREAYLETDYPKGFGCPAMQGLVRGRWKFLSSGGSELFDLEKDPGELNNLATEREEIWREKKERLKESFKDRTEKSAFHPLSARERRWLEEAGSFPAWGKEGAGRPGKMIHAVLALEEGTFLLRRGMVNEALPFLETLYELASHFPRSSLLLGSAYRRLGDKKFLPRAEELLQEAVQKDRELSEAWAELGIVLNRKGEKGRAAEAFQEAMKGDVVDPENLDKVGLFWMGRGALEEAFFAFQKVVKSRRKAAAGYYRLALLYFRMEKFQEARIQAEEAVQKSPRDPRYHRTLGDILFALGDREGAIQAYRRAKKRDPKNDILYEELIRRALE